MRFILLIALSAVSSTAYCQKIITDSPQIYRQARIDSIQSLLAFRPGDRIADIGSGNGSTLICLTAKAQNISVFAEDIDSSKCNKKSFKKILQQVNSQTPLDSFHFVYGTDSSTTLPKHYFNKIFLIAVVHEFTRRQEMLADIKSLLKADGEILIEEPLVHKPKKKDRGCNNPYLLENELLKILIENNFVILKEKNISDKDMQGNRYRKVYLCKLKN